MFVWIFQRVSGVALIIMLLIHIIVMHYTKEPGFLTFEQIVKRLSNPSWKLFDILFITLALPHGLFGVKMVVDDYVDNDTVRLLIISAIVILGLFLYTVGVVSIISF